MEEPLFRVYDSEERLVCEGTAEECANIMNVTVRTIQMWATPKHHEKFYRKPEPREYNVKRSGTIERDNKQYSRYEIHNAAGEIVCEGTAQECGDFVGIKKKTIQMYATPIYQLQGDKKKPGPARYKAEHINEAKGGRKRTRFAVYDSKGEFVCEGLPEECAEILGVDKQTIRYWATPAAKRRQLTRKNFQGYTADRINEDEWKEVNDTNMKVNVDYGEVHAAIEALKNKDLLTDRESAAALKVLVAVLGDYVPTLDEYKRHNSNVTRLEKMDYESNPGRWQEVADEIREFENKYL